MIPGSASPFFLGSSLAAATPGGLQISRSLRFNSSDSGYCGRVPASASNRTTWTFSAWIKRSQLGVLQRFFSGATATNDDDWTAILFNSSDQLVIGGYNTFFRTSNSVYRDCSAWYHLVITADLGNGTNALKLRAWINNVEVTWASTSSNPSTTGINSANNHAIGAEQSPNNGGVGSYFNGYLANIHFIDGQALTPSSFTETDATTGQLIPKTYTGSYGTNGFNLLFADNSSNTASTLGKDYSGLGNNWTPNNFSVADGTTSYIGSTSGSLYSGSWINAFDGNIPSGYKTGAPYNYNTTSTLTFASALSGTIEVYGANGGSGTGGVAYIALSDGSQWDVSNITAPNSQWYSFGSKTGITSISLVSNGVSQGVFLNGIRVNGVILIDRSFSSGNDSLVDSPTNYGTDTGVGGTVRGNYCTLNPLQLNTITLSNGNLDINRSTGGAWRSCFGTFAMPTSGKWYFETTLSGTATVYVGLVSTDSNLAGLVSTYPVDTSTAYTIYAADDNIYSGPGNTDNGSSGLGNFTTGDVVQVLYDADNGNLKFGKNNTLMSSNAYTGLNTRNYLPVIGTFSTGDVICNFGQRAFAYTAPSGFKALCTQNLPAPLVTKSNTAMDVVTYMGNAGTQSITGLAFNPDFVWIKGRDATPWHALFDSVRGTGLRLSSNVTNAETGNGTTDLLQSFNSNGFTVNATLNGGPDTSVNWDGSGGAASSYVAWTWDAGTSTVSNTQGSITSQVRANATAGFSVVSVPGYTYPTKTAGHGLGVEPHFIITKSRGVSNPWIIYHKSAGANTYFQFDTGAGYTGVAGVWSGVTSTVFPLNSGVNQQTDIVAYCFAPVVGYSSFGSYTGGGSAGRFVYTGFRPKLIWVKNYNDGSYPTLTGWFMWDSVRGAYNYNQSNLIANTSNIEGVRNNGGSILSIGVDILSNGFCLRGADDADTNWGSGQYIYCAWAEMPFNYSRAR